MRGFLLGIFLLTGAAAFSPSFHHSPSILSPQAPRPCQACAPLCLGFSPPRPGLRRSSSLSLRAESQPGVGVKCLIPSWDELYSRLPLSKRRAISSPQEEADVLFFRDQDALNPDCQRLWLALLEKGINFVEKSVEVEAEVPALTINGTYVSGLRECLLALEEKHPAVRLLPIGADDRTEALKWIVASDTFIPLDDFLRGDREGAAEAEDLRTDMEEAIMRLEEALAAKEGDFLLGDRFTVADIAMVPILNRLEAQAPAVDPLLQIRGNPMFPQLQGWYEAMDTRVASYRSRVKADDHTLCKSLESFGLSSEAKKGMDMALTARDWKEILAEKIPPVWVQFESRITGIAAKPKIEAAAALIVNKDHLLAETAKHVAQTVQGQKRTRPEGESMEMPDLGLRLLADALIEAPDYGSAPTFANSFIGTMLSDLSVDELTELGEIMGFLRRVVEVPKDMGVLPSQTWRAHCAWVGREVRKAIRDKEE
mmetsp:Transcript_30368/g.47573  ORF Transcript_30368/g.47573 Transcript_30368/m.47573 type:complete len:483 (-) Transcript_30368:91-1539(-)